MVLFLIENVLSDTLDLRGTNCQPKVTRLPFEFFLTHHLVNPARRVGFDIAQDVIQTMGGTQPDKQMNMIFNAPKSPRELLCSLNNTAKIGM